MPALAGMRGLAALGVVVTHVAFQTGADRIPVLGRVFGRFDMAVAVFFALSGLLLWRGPAAAARGIGRFRLGDYLLHRAARILPAYWLVVVAVLALLPGAAHDWRVWASNLALTQVFVPLTLTTGMTQMWSLSVEVAFYLALPLFVLVLSLLRGRRAGWRIPVIVGLALPTLGWAFVPIATPAAIHSENWLPGYLPWFAVGMVLAEVEARRTARASARSLAGWWVVAGVMFGLAATDLGGPSGLARLEPWQFATKIALGAVMAFALLWPLLGAPRGYVARWLSGPVAQTVGRWSYGIFLWHLAVLASVFPVFAILPFHGHFVFVLIVTVLLTLPVAAASYALVEEPVRQAIRRVPRTPLPLTPVPAPRPTHPDIPPPTATER